MYQETFRDKLCDFQYDLLCKWWRLKNEVFLRTKYKHIKKKDLYFLYSIGFYDGVLSGVARYKGLPVYFSCYDSSHHTKRQFLIYPIWNYEWKICGENELFEKYVGSRDNLFSSGARKPRKSLKPESEWKIIMIVKTNMFCI